MAQNVTRKQQEWAAQRAESLARQVAEALEASRTIKGTLDYAEWNDRTPREAMRDIQEQLEDLARSIRSFGRPETLELTETTVRGVDLAIYAIRKTMGLMGVEEGGDV